VRSDGRPNPDRIRLSLLRHDPIRSTQSKWLDRCVWVWVPIFVGLCVVRRFLLFHSFCVFILNVLLETCGLEVWMRFSFETSNNKENSLGRLPLSSSFSSYSSFCYFRSRVGYEILRSLVCRCPRLHAVRSLRSDCRRG
jgi:hypothetical protein